jgi:hypothetical protein
MGKLALVLGATGGVGGEVARRLASRGWQIRALNRRPDRVEPASGIEWIRGDALVAADVAAAARGASLLVHAVNPPGYRDWGMLVLPMLDNTIAAARANGARILLPGTVYNYGPDAFPDIREDAPQRPRTAKGRIRVEMGAAASRGGGLRGSPGADRARRGLLRPAAREQLVQPGLVKPGQRPRVVSYPGRPGVGHQWAYLPDVRRNHGADGGGRGPRQLRQLPHGRALGPDGMRITDAIRRVLGEPGRSGPPAALVGDAARLALRAGAARASGMKYLWDRRPCGCATTGSSRPSAREARTPLDEAVRTTLAAIGCLEGAGSAAPSAGMLASSRSRRRFRAFRARERNGNIVTEQVRRGFVRNRTLRSERGRTERERRRGHIPGSPDPAPRSPTDGAGWRGREGERAHSRPIATGEPERPPEPSHGREGPSKSGRSKG